MNPLAHRGFVGPFLLFITSRAIERLMGSVMFIGNASASPEANELKRSTDRSGRAAIPCC
jgi:hypothetical protein